MNQKGFANVVLIALIIILAGIVGYFALVRKSPVVTQQPNIPTTQQPNTEAAQETNIPSELKSLIEKDLKYLYSYTVQKSGEAIESKDVAYTSVPIDLNNDGVAEFIVSNVKIKGIPIAGASANQDFLIYGKINLVWRKLGTLSGNQYTVLNSRSGNYSDIETSFHLSAFEAEKTVYKWNGKSYESIAKPPKSP